METVSLHNCNKKGRNRAVDYPTHRISAEFIERIALWDCVLNFCGIMCSFFVGLCVHFLCFFGFGGVCCVCWFVFVGGRCGGCGGVVVCVVGGGFGLCFFCRCLFFWWFFMRLIVIAMYSSVLLMVLFGGAFVLFGGMRLL